MPENNYFNVNYNQDINNLIEQEKNILDSNYAITLENTEQRVTNHDNTIVSTTETNIGTLNNTDLFIGTINNTDLLPSVSRDLLDLSNQVIDNGFLTLYDQIRVDRDYIHQRMNEYLNEYVYPHINKYMNEQFEKFLLANNKTENYKKDYSNCITFDQEKFKKKKRMVVY